MARDVHIGALSARTPLGLIAETAAAAVRAGLSRLEEHPVFLGRDGEPVCGAVDPRLDVNLRGVERLFGIAQAALVELGAKLNLKLDGSASLPLLLALPDPRPGWTGEDMRVLAQRLATVAFAGLPPLDPTACALGHAGALRALGLAAEQIAAGAQDLVVVGGVDSYFDGPTASWLDKRRLLAGSGSRAGLFPGEGASFVLVGDRVTLRSLGLPSLAVVRGWSSASDCDRLGADPEPTGVALTEAVHGATASLASPHERVDDVYCDINGERYRSEEWGLALLRCAERFVDGTRYLAATDSWGDMGAASGALSCVLAARAWARNHAAGPLALAWGSSMNGLRSAVLLERPHA